MYVCMYVCMYVSVISYRFAPNVSGEGELIDGRQDDDARSRVEYLYLYRVM